MQNRPLIFWWTAVSAVLMVVGGFGPWATALGVATVSGTHGDGWFLIIGGVLAFALLFRQAAKPARWPMIVAALLGALGALVALVDLSDINSFGDTTIFGDVVDPAWGLYLSLIASASLIVAAIATLVRRPYATAAQPIPAEA
jgi:hypothetical protein